MNSVNHVMVLGNLTRDPELRYTPSGTAVCQLGVALNRRWRDQAGELQQEVTFVDVTVWSKQAETVAQYLTKGRAVAIEGRLQQDTWETEGGERRSRLKVVAQRVTFLSSANGSPAPSAVDGEEAPDWVNEGGGAMKRELLEKPFTPAQIRQRKGRNGMLDYVEGHTVIQRLNEALEGEWSFEIMHHEVREEEVLVVGKLSAGPVVKMAFGGSQVTRERESGGVVSLGDDLKAAATDIAAHLNRPGFPEGCTSSSD